jgi:hypothetical protein
MLLCVVDYWQRYIKTFCIERGYHSRRRMISPPSSDIAAAVFFVEPIQVNRFPSVRNPVIVLSSSPNSEIVSKAWRNPPNGAAHSFSFSGVCGSLYGRTKSAPNDLTSSWFFGDAVVATRMPASLASWIAKSPTPVAPDQIRIGVVGGDAAWSHGSGIPRR